MRTFVLVLIAAMIGMVNSAAYPCTDFRVTAQDGTVVIA